MRLVVQILLVVLCFSCANSTVSDLSFFEGTWKREHKDQFEVWERKNSTELSGYAYKMENGQKIITETLAIRIVGGQMVYEATVPEQNEGTTIQFTFNSEIDSVLSFENNDHDFPKKIQYKRLSNNQLRVAVLGDNDSGFSFVQSKQRR